MDIRLEDIGKRYKKEWIFKLVNQHITTNSATVIRGNNGSGKSTLLRILSGYEKATTGSIKWMNSDLLNYGLVNFTSPAASIPSELTLTELVDFHRKLKTLDLPNTNLEENFNLTGVDHKRLSDFSSGMLQRVKLGLAIFSTGELLLLDEPTSNLDAEGISWYKETIEKQVNNKTIVIASNDIQEEYYFCEKEIKITDYK